MDATERQLRRKIASLELKIKNLLDVLLEMSEWLPHPINEVTYGKLLRISEED